VGKVYALLQERKSYFAMSKRKLHEHNVDRDSDEGIDVDAPFSGQQQKRRVEATIEDAQKQIFRGLKVARGFERQKLGRRQKAAKSSGKEQDIARLEAEVQVLKMLDLTVTAEHYLNRYLARTKSVASHPACPPYVIARGNEPAPSQDVAYANVTARLYKSNPIKEAIEVIIGDVREILDLKVDEKDQPKKRMRRADYESTGASKSEQHSDSVDERQSRLPQHRKNGVDDAEGERSLFIDPAQPSLRVASATDVGEEEEEENDAADEDFYTALKAQNQTRGNQDLDLDASDASPELLDESEFEGFTTSDENSSEPTSAEPMKPISRDRPKPSAKQKRPEALPQTSRTTFLTSLTAGYISGSESATDLDDDPAFSTAVRKNRRGQRARQAIWEQKYGASAKHLKNGDGNRAMGRDQGWDSKRGATDGRGGDKGRSARDSHRGGRGGRDAMRRAVQPAGNNANRLPLGKRESEAPKKDPTYGKSHPSWDARKKVKEATRLSAVPKGKKITFD